MVTIAPLKMVMTWGMVYDIVLPIQFAPLWIEFSESCQQPFILDSAKDFRPTGQWQVHHHRTAYEFRLGCRGSSITIQMVPNVFSFVMDRIPGSIWSYRINI
jgi:hypothetical protein